MTTVSEKLKLLMELARAQAVLARKFDGGLGGLGFSEFVILYHLSGAHEEKMRRTDLAEKIGLTASGITRLLLPMEKIGLVKRLADERDARVSYVLLASGGKRRLVESLDRAELLAEDIVPTAKNKNIGQVSELLKRLV